MKKVLHHMMYDILSKEHWAYRSDSLIAAYCPGNPIWLVADEQKPAADISGSISRLARQCIANGFSIASAASVCPLGRRLAKELGNECSSQLLTAYYCASPIKPEKKGCLIYPDQADAGRVAGFVAGFGRETLGIEYTAEEALETAMVLIATKKLYCWYDKRITGMCWIAGHYSGMAKLNYIYVPEHFRGQGYAKLLVSQVCSISLEEGMLPVLYTSSDNILTNNLYRSLGFSPAGELEMTYFI